MANPEARTTYPPPPRSTLATGAPAPAVAPAQPTRLSPLFDVEAQVELEFQAHADYLLDVAVEFLIVHTLLPLCMGVLMTMLVFMIHCTFKSLFPGSGEPPETPPPEISWVNLMKGLCVYWVVYSWAIAASVYGWEFYKKGKMRRIRAEVLERMRG